MPREPRVVWVRPGTIADVKRIREERGCSLREAWILAGRPGVRIGTEAEREADLRTGVPDAG